MSSPGDREPGSRQFALAIALLVVVIAAGTAGYVAIEGWSAWDAFYMTVISVTTVGYREVHDLSRAGQVFTAGLLITGVGAVFYTITLLAAGIIESRVHPRVQEKRRARMIDRLTDHFILCGAGRIGLIGSATYSRLTNGRRNDLHDRKLRQSQCPCARSLLGQNDQYQNRRRHQHGAAHHRRYRRIFQGYVDRRQNRSV